MNASSPVPNPRRSGGAVVVAGSVGQRLLNLSKKKGQDITLTLVRLRPEREA